MSCDLEDRETGGEAFALKHLPEIIGHICAASCSPIGECPRIEHLSPIPGDLKQYTCPCGTKWQSLAWYGKGVVPLCPEKCAKERRSQNWKRAAERNKQKREAARKTRNNGVTLRNGSA